MWAERVVIFVENSPFALGRLMYRLWGETQTKAVGATELSDSQQAFKKTAIPILQPM